MKNGYRCVNCGNTVISDGIPSKVCEKCNNLSWQLITYKTDKEYFLNYCESHLRSIRVAIDRKSRGSRVEDSYFLEHFNKLKDFFLESEVEEKIKEVTD